MVLREGARGQTLRKVAFLASAFGTAQGSCAPTTGQTLRAAVWSANCRAGETRSGDFHTPRSQRFNGQSGRVCRAQPEACVSVRARALSVPLILRSFPSFVFFLLSSMFLVYSFGTHYVCFPFLGVYIFHQ